MFKINRLTDYATHVLGALARSPQTDDGLPLSASEIANATGLPMATTTKILKALSKAALVIAERGVHGGYRLAHDANDISAADVLQALEGPMALTHCCAPESSCELINHCQVSSSWQTINQSIQHTLQQVTLSDLVGQPQQLKRKLNKPTH